MNEQGLPPNEDFVPATSYHFRTPVEVQSPRWMDAEQTMIDIDVLFEELRPMGHIVFTATANADTDHGRAIWDGCIAGDYGIIANYVPAPELTPEEQRAQMPPISKRQLRLTLVRNGISLSDLDAAILAMGDEAVIEWQDASEYRRLHPLLNQVATHLSLTQEQVDAMWQQALTA